MRELQNKLNELQKLQEAGRTISKANEGKIKAAIKALQDIIAKLGDGKEPVKEAEQKEAIEQAKDLLEAERTHSEIRSILRTALKTHYNDKYGPFIQDTADSFVIYNRDSDIDNKTYKINYTIDDKNKVTFGDPVEVIRKTSWETVQQPARESQTKTEFSGECIPLVEKGLRRDGTIPIKIIQPGWGDSGYYAKEVLERDAGVYKTGTKMYWDHPKKSDEVERPERSLRDLAGVLVSDGKFLKDGPDGPGIYADAKVFGPYQETLTELAPYIGISHRAFGHAKQGEAEGRKGPIIDKIMGVESVDFVTTPGAGGKVLELFESARDKAAKNSGEIQWQAITLDEVKRNRPDLIEGLRTEIKAAVYGDKEKFKEGKQMSEEKLKELEKENRRLKESLILREARDFVCGEIKESKLPEITKQRLTESLAQSPKLDKEGNLDKDEYKKQIKEAIDTEIDYIAKLTGSGEIKGMGEGDPGEATNLEEAEKVLEDSFARLGMSESAAKIAAKGRN